MPVLTNRLSAFVKHTVRSFMTNLMCYFISYAASISALTSDRADALVV